ncbi:MAG: site-specific integrase [Chitinophagaceae bacterium]|nr:site-specific integrase [Chitinophagaceae bacterium]
MIRVPTISVKYNWRKSSNRSGLHGVHLRIYLSGEQSRHYPIKLPAKISKDQWHGKENHWVKNNHPFYFEINCKIAEMITKLNDLTRRYYSQNKPVTFYTIEKELMLRGERNIFNDYFANYIKHPPESTNLDEVTWEKYRACLLHLNNFQKRITFSQIDEALIARFKNYLANLKGRKGKMEPATIKSYWDKLKVVLTHAAKKDHFLDPVQVENYFEEVTVSVPKKKEGQHLEIQEVQRLKNLTFDEKDKSLQRDRDLFLFQVYTGFYYNDLQILRKDQLFNDIEQGHYIIGERDKNGNPTIIPLFKFPYATNIIEKYKDNNPDNPILFSKSVFIEIQAYNRNLKLLGKRAGIVRKISNKTGRHTNAQMWIRFGADRPVLSKMMGHEKEQTTQSYYRVGLLEVIEGTKGIDFEKLAI